MLRTMDIAPAKETPTKSEDEPTDPDPEAAAEEAPKAATEEPADAEAGSDGQPAEEAHEGSDDTPAPTREKRPPKLGPGAKRSDEELQREAAALLFASVQPLSVARLVALLERPETARVRAVLEALGQALESSPLPVVLREMAGGWRLLTDPDMGDVLTRLVREPRPERISGAALETLAIVAYRQPVTKAEVEAIRGVQAGPMLRMLVDRSLVRVVGRADQPGSPLQYGTTKDFLDRFGLASLKDLPRDGELAES